MVADDFMTWMLPGLIAGSLAVNAWFTRRAFKDMDELKRDSQDCKVRTSDLRGHVSEHYAKKAEVQHSLNRIHSRLDSLPKEIIDALRGRA